jgi:hypothetical protein
MTGLNEFKEWVAMERKSIECTLPFWAGDYNYDMVRYEKARLDELDRVEKEFERCLKGE